MGLDELRRQLDALDEQMLSLLSDRAQMIVKVADFKRQHDMPVHVPEREAAIIERLCSLNPGPLNGETIARIYRTIIEEMRRFESEHVVFQDELSGRLDGL